MNTHTPPRGPQHLEDKAPDGAHDKDAPLDEHLQCLETIVACESTWRPIENFEALHNSANPARSGSYRRQYTFMDIVVMDVATQLYWGSREAAARTLGDPLNWERLRHAARQAFPNDPKRRLSQRAPSRYQRYRALKKYFCGEALAALGQDVRAEIAAACMDMFDPATGTWTHPDRSQRIVGDAT